MPTFELKFRDSNHFFPHLNITCSVTAEYSFWPRGASPLYYFGWSWLIFISPKWFCRPIIARFRPSLRDVTSITSGSYSHAWGRRLLLGPTIRLKCFRRRRLTGALFDAADNAAITLADSVFIDHYRAILRRQADDGDTSFRALCIFLRNVDDLLRH